MNVQLLVLLRKRKEKGKRDILGFTFSEKYIATIGISTIPITVPTTTMPTIIASNHKGGMLQSVLS